MCEKLLRTVNRTIAKPNVKTQLLALTVRSSSSMSICAELFAKTGPVCGADLDWIFLLIGPCVLRFQAHLVCSKWERVVAACWIPGLEKSCYLWKAD